MEIFYQALEVIVSLDNTLLEKYFGLYASGLIGLVLIYKRLGVITELFKSLVNKSVFNKYNNSLTNVNLKRVSYTFRNFQVKEKSQELFETLKAIYDKENSVNVPFKEVRIVLYEFQNVEHILTNVTRFLNYYKEKNGILIVFKISDIELKKSLKSQIEILGIEKDVRVI